MNLIFSEIYWSMTAVGRVQSEWNPSGFIQFARAPLRKGFIYFARDPLRSYLNELRKKNKIHFVNVFLNTARMSLILEDKTQSIIKTHMHLWSLHSSRKPVAKTLHRKR